MIIKYFSWVKDIVGKSEETISISPDIDTPEKLIDFLIKKNEQYKKAFSKRETSSVIFILYVCSLMPVIKISLNTMNKTGMKV